MKKLTLLVAATAGYVLGSRAGRERYEQIKTQATKAWNTEPVQSVVDGAQTQAKHAASDLGTKVADVASDAKTKVSDKVSGSTTPGETDLPRSTNGLA